MIEKIVAGLILIGMGCLALYTAFIKPYILRNHFDEAFGIPLLIRRVMFTVLGIGAIALGIYGLLLGAGVFK